MRRTPAPHPHIARLRAARLLVACVVPVLGCPPPATPGEAAQGEPGSGGPTLGGTAMIADDVRLTLSVVGDDPRAGEAFELELTVLNDGEAQAVIDFPNAQRYDLEIFAADETRVWHWAEEMMFAMVLGQETIPGGETRSWREAVPGGLDVGTYRVVGTLTAMERQSVEISLEVAP